MMKVKILVIAAVWLSASSLSSQEAQSNSCGCADKQDLINALNMSQMAIQELKNQLDLLSEREKTGGKTEMYSDDAYSRLRELIAGALNHVRKGEGENFGIYKINRRDCSLTRKSAQRECARQIEKSLFDVYKKACDETKNLPLDETPYRAMKQVIQHEISAFQEMQNFVLKMLKSLPKDCRPNNWFGYVVYQKVYAVETKKTIPPKNTQYNRPGAGIPISNGGSESTIHKRIYTGTILVEEGKASTARGYAQWNLDTVATSTGRVYCSPNKPDAFTAFTGGKNDYAMGEQTGTAEFVLNIYPARSYYAISTSFFPVRATGQMSFYRNVAGGCKEEKAKNSNPVSTLEKTEPYKIEEKIEPGAPDYLEGSKTEKPPLLNQSLEQGNTSVKNTFEIQMRWMLRRLPAK